MGSIQQRFSFLLHDDKLKQQFLMEKKEESSLLFQYPKQDTNILKPNDSLDNNVSSQRSPKKR